MPKSSKFEILRTKWPRITDYRETRMRCLMVDGRYRGNGRREYFKTITEAKTRADQLVTERENHGSAALNFPAKDRVMAVECRELLAPGPKSKGLQALMNYVNGQSGPSTMHRGSSRIDRKPKAESSVEKTLVSVQGNNRKIILVEMTVGPTIFYRWITSAEADKIIRLTPEPWQNKSSCR